MASPLSGLFETPTNEPTLGDKIIAGLGGFGAGVRGRGSEFVQGIIDQREKLDLERQKAMANDAMSVYRMLNEGMYDDAIGLIDRRVKAINELGGNPEDTLEIRQLITAGRIPEASSELQNFIRQAMQAGVIEPAPQPQMIKAGDLTDAGQAIFVNPDGSVSAVDAAGYRQPAKPGYEVISPQEAASMGLDPSRQYQRNTENGQITAIGGAGVNTVVNLPTPVDKATEEYGKSIGERAASRIEAAQNAAQQNVTLDRMIEAIANGARTGAGQSVLLDLQNYAQSLFGIPISEGASEQEVMRALGNRLVMEVRNPANGLGLTGSTSNRDLEFLDASVPNLGKTPEGNALLIEVLKKQNKFRQDVGAFQQAIIDANNGVVPSNLDSQVMRYVNDYKFLDDSLKEEIEAASKAAERPRASSRFTIEVID